MLAKDQKIREADVRVLENMMRVEQIRGEAQLQQVKAQQVERDLRNHYGNLEGEMNRKMQERIDEANQLTLTLERRARQAQACETEISELRSELVTSTNELATARTTIAALEREIIGLKEHEVSLNRQLKLSGHNESDNLKRMNDLRSRLNEQERRNHALQKASQDMARSKRGAQFASLSESTLATTDPHASLAGDMLLEAVERLDDRADTESIRRQVQQTRANPQFYSNLHR